MAWSKSNFNNFAAEEQCHYLSPFNINNCAGSGWSPTIFSGHAVPCLKDEGTEPLRKLRISSVEVRRETLSNSSSHFQKIKWSWTLVQLESMVTFLGIPSGASLRPILISLMRTEGSHQWCFIHSNSNGFKPDADSIVSFSCSTTIQHRGFLFFITKGILDLNLAHWQSTLHVFLLMARSHDMSCLIKFMLCLSIFSSGSISFALIHPIFPSLLRHSNSYPSHLL